MEPWVMAVIASATTVIASQGFWLWVTNRNKKRSSHDRLLLGLAYDRIIHLGMVYIEDGGITKDEFEALDSLFQAYKELGGNGVAERVMNDLRNVPMKQVPRYVKRKEIGEKDE